MGFINGLPVPAPAKPVTSDAVIVYTGGGGNRISAAMALFAEGVGERMLISGVHENTSRERLSQFWRGDQQRFSCCVDLGRLAQSTQGNAAEAQDWVITRNYNSIILVTSEYHMPRAIIATRETMPDIKITPYPVASSLLDGNGKPNSFEAWKQIAGEYTKFLIEKTKSALHSIRR